MMLPLQQESQPRVATLPGSLVQLAARLNDAAASARVAGKSAYATGGYASDRAL